MDQSNKKVLNKKQMSKNKVPCPSQTPLLSTSHYRSLGPHYHFGSWCPWILKLPILNLIGLINITEI